MLVVIVIVIIAIIIYSHFLLPAAGLSQSEKPMNRTNERIICYESAAGGRRLQRGLT
jgi:hypothetical protein